MTDGSVRRAEIAALLEKADSPLSAAHLASQLGVSRQVIVGDIALLRASGAAITATPRGYITERGRGGLRPHRRLHPQPARGHGERTQHHGG